MESPTPVDKLRYVYASMLEAAYSLLLVQVFMLYQTANCLWLRSLLHTKALEVEQNQCATYIYNSK
jgi:hypothetical protein